MFWSAGYWSTSYLVECPVLLTCIKSNEDAKSKELINEGDL